MLSVGTILGDPRRRAVKLTRGSVRQRGGKGVVVADAWHRASFAKDPRTDAELCLLVQSPVAEVAAAGRRAIMERHLGLASARAIRWCGDRWEEFLADALGGLCRAAEKYDPDVAMFSTYAVWWVDQRLQHAVVADTIVRGARDVRNLKLAASARATDAAKLTRKSTGIDGDRARAVVERRASGLAEVMVLDERHALRRAMGRLPRKVREIVWRRTMGETLKTVGEAVGLSRERVRQVEAEAMGLLRIALRSDVDVRIPPPPTRVRRTPTRVGERKRGGRPPGGKLAVVTEAVVAAARRAGVGGVGVQVREAAEAQGVKRGSVGYILKLLRGDRRVRIEVREVGHAGKRPAWAVWVGDGEAQKGGG